MPAQRPFREWNPGNDHDLIVRNADLVQGIDGLSGGGRFSEYADQLGRFSHLSSLFDLGRGWHQQTSDPTQGIAQTPFLDLPDRHVGDDA